MKILFIKNTGCEHLGNVMWMYAEWINKYIDVTIHEASVSLPLSYKSFGTFNNKNLWGLDGIKNQLRSAGVPSGYDVILFFYYPNPPKDDLANWTYPNDLQGAAFCELPFEQVYLLECMKHETCHALHRILNWKGIDAYDTLDVNGSIESNMSRILQYRDALTNSLTWQLYSKLLKARNLLLTLLNTTMVEESRILAFAKAIQTYEGWFAGSRSCRNNNPGNIKYIGQKNATKDDAGFCVFSTYEDGLNALVSLLRNAMTGKSKVYKPEMTIIDFFNTYAPSYDNNNPNAYALFVAKQLNVSANTQIKNI